MLWELINHGSLWPWEWPVFIACALILIAGPTVIWLIWVTRPKDGGHDGQE